MRVALLITDLERGGAPLRIARLARGLRDAGQEVGVGCLAPLGPVGRDLRADGFDVFAAGAESVFSTGVFRRLERALRERKPEIIHSTLVHANFAARVIGRRLKIPVITSTATIEVERRWHVWLERWTRGWDCGHLVNSAALAAHVVAAFRRDPARVFVAPPSVERRAPPARRAARQALELPADAFVVAWAGRLDPVKRVDVLMDAFDSFVGAARGGAARLLIAGDGPDAARIAARKAQSPYAERIALLGWRDDLDALFAAADCVACPSRTEGMPNVVLEAMAVGAPVIAPPLPVMRELAGPDDARRLWLTPDDSVAALAAALGAIHAAPADARAVGDRAAEWVAAELSVEKTTAATLAAYAMCVRG